MEQPGMIKFCENQECVAGWHDGEPSMIWSSSVEFKFAKFCTMCGGKLTEVGKIATHAPAGVAGLKRERDENGVDDRGRGDSKRLRPELSMPTVPEKLTGGRGGGGGDRGGLDNRDAVPSGGQVSHLSSTLDELFQNFGGLDNEEVVDAEVGTKEDKAGSETESKKKPGDAKDGGRGLKWCLKCNRGGHTTSDCRGAKVTKEVLVADLHWRQYNRGTGFAHLWQAPRHAPALMDQLTTHQLAFWDVEDFSKARDNLFFKALERNGVLSRLDPELDEDETPEGIYEILVIKASNTTKTFVMSVVQAILATFKAVVTGRRVKLSGETNVQFRARMAAMVADHRNALAFPLPRGTVETLAKTFETSWKMYVARMDELEQDYLGRHFHGRVLSRGEQRLVRLPTSYLRLQVKREAEGKPLIFPVFRPVNIATLEMYMDDNCRSSLDWL